MTRPTPQIEAFSNESAQRRLIALKYWLYGKEYHEALRAFEYNRKLFDGFRKDGVTPEFDHHVSQAQFVRTLLPSLSFPEETVATIFFHDTAEDKGTSFDEIASVFSQPAFGERVAQATWKVTKVFRGEKYDEAKLFKDMSTCPIASIVKGIDRIHNFQTMVGVFSLAKQKQYIEEGVGLFLPMLKEAESRFPAQEAAYKNIRTFLKSQMQLIQAIHVAHDRTS